MFSRTLSHRAARLRPHNVCLACFLGQLSTGRAAAATFSTSTPARHETKTRRVKSVPSAEASKTVRRPLSGRPAPGLKHKKTSTTSKTPSSPKKRPPPGKPTKGPPEVKGSSAKSNKQGKSLADIEALYGWRKISAIGKGSGKTRPAKRQAKDSAEPIDIKTVHADGLRIDPVDVDGQPLVPSLSYGLERVLFNPGVYHLQDPRSRVFNFDPYLQTIMPVAEFDFDALKEYITSSRDESLGAIARREGKKYVGSSSSMTGALSHFHYLLSQWRVINTSAISQGFPDKLRSFTMLQRTPAAIFLRWKDGYYAIDADKEFDSANILSMLGKSMEKLLTMPTDEFERYRKSSAAVISDEERDGPEAFHYCKMGDFLMRSQLDAHDPRLPGTGMFDLKTRAAVSIRMDTRNYKKGMGYEIKGRHGEWESFEREYFDMIRAAFLKYSLQVRMGRMDGIFVAFHNIERIFGFQYISQPEMDLALHGTWDASVGDQEFKFSLELLNKVLDRAAEKFPGKSLRLHFETRETKTPFMYIFAEPVTEEQITEIQTKNQAKIELFESEVLGLHRDGEEVDSAPDENASKEEWDAFQAEVEAEVEHDEVSSGKVRLDLSSDPEVVSSPKSPAPSPPTQAGPEGVDHIHEKEPEPEEDEQAGNHGDHYDESSVADSMDECQDSAPVEAEIMESAVPEEMMETVPEVTEGDEASSGLDESEDQSRAAEDEEDNTTGLAEVEAAENENERVEDSDENADQEWLDDVERERQDEEELAGEQALLGMTLAVRNKVNGEYVARPGTLSEQDKWSVEYSLSEMPSATRAWSLYGACQMRRKRGLDFGEKEEEGVAASYYIRQLHEMSKQGRRWRREQDAKEKKHGRIVLDQSVDGSFKDE